MQSSFEGMRAQLTQLRSGHSKRASSWDTTGGNDDCIRIDAGETRVLAEVKGSGVITHIYFTAINADPLDFRDALIRMYWDGEETPSVDVPFGDFFCVGNCSVRQFSSLLMAVNPGGGGNAFNSGFNCYFPMPFNNGARIELVNQSDRTFGGALGRLWYHIDYETIDQPLPWDIGRFHAQWRRQNPTPVNDAPLIDKRGAYPRENLTGDENYVLLEAKGRGHMAGIFLQVNNIQGGWYGEGDDMIFIDGDTWPPSLHGTGTEEIFGGGACPDHEYASHYSGFLQVENKDHETFRGLNAMYRWYMNDPIRFQRSIRFTIEHGHANDYKNDYASVAYWYQEEPHAPFPQMPAVEDRRPLFPDVFFEAHGEYVKLTQMHIGYQDAFVFQSEQPPEWLESVKQHMNSGYNELAKGDYERAYEVLHAGVKIAEQNGYSF
jgi:hypothetical protein